MVPTFAPPSVQPTPYDALTLLAGLFASVHQQGTIATSSATQATASSRIQVIRLPRPIAMDEFGHRYNVPVADRAKLIKLEVVLGDRRCEDLPEKEWKDAGFTMLAWERFKDKHARFCDDITTGLWDGSDDVLQPT